MSSREQSAISVEYGFSLVEMAIVLLIIGVILGGLLGAIGQSTENTRRLEAKSKLREIEEALYGYAQVQGRLPCPGDDDTNGAEDLGSGTTANGDCGRYYGLLPNATLGLAGGVDDNGFLLDPWGNPYRYAVGRSAAPYDFTGSTEISTMYPLAAAQLTGTNLLRVCDNSACSGAVMSDIVPAVVLSMGKNWAELSGSSSASEQENSGDGSTTTTGGDYDVTTTRTFVVADYSEENFDDMLTWLSPHLLFSKMIEAGKLP